MKKNRKERMEEEKDARMQSKIRNKFVFLAIILCVFVFFFIKGFSLGDLGEKVKGGIENKQEEKQEEKAEIAPDLTSWELILVNHENILSEDFRVDLGKVTGGKVDARVVEPLMNMLKAAKEGEIELIVTSSYRSVSQQKKLHEAEIAKHIEEGLSQEESIAEAMRYVSLPGASEHHTGLAVDFTTTDTPELTEAFAKTDAYKWLKENAATYGFVERYGKRKEKVTKIAWEPWHYRYVGVENAMEMVKEKDSLEEYIERFQEEKKSES